MDPAACSVLSRVNNVTSRICPLEGGAILTFEPFCILKKLPFTVHPQIRVWSLFGNGGHTVGYLVTFYLHYAFTEGTVRKTAGKH